MRGKTRPGFPANSRKQVKFFGRQFYLPLGDRYFTSTGSTRKWPRTIGVSSFISRRPWPRGPAQHGLNAGFDFAQAKRLGDVIVGAHFQAQNLVDYIVLGGEHQNGHLRILLSQLLADGQAVHLWQHQVEYHHIGAFFVQNGIPWWYGDGLNGRPQAPDLSRLDPGGAIRGAVGIERTIGAVVTSSNQVIAPGVVRNISPERNMLWIAEVDDRQSPRVLELRKTLIAAGIASPATPTSATISGTS